MSSIWNAWDQPTLVGLLANIGTTFATLLVINVVVFTCGLAKYSERVNPSFAPSSVAIAIVWFALFILNGAARWSLNGNVSPTATRLKSILFAIFLINVTHPIYNAGFRLYIPALIGTITPFALTIYVLWAAWNVNRLTSLLIAPTAIWFCYAGLVIVSALGWIPLR